jgi:AAA15 family ATPase/GTPase
MNIIKQIEIKNFRSFGNRRKESYKLIKANDLNIISGANDSGKSNVLRALNLFFNGNTNHYQFFDFERDFFRKSELDELDVKEEIVTVKIWFFNDKNKNKNRTQPEKAYLPAEFWVSKKWKKTSQYSNADLRSSIEIDFEKEKGDFFNNFLVDSSSDNKDLISNFKAGLQKQLTDFLSAIQFHYVPAIKDKDYFSHLFGELQQTLWKTKTSIVENKKVDFETAIQKETDKLMLDFKDSIASNTSAESIAPVFQLPADLINLFRALVVQTGNVDLTLRGDGLQAKLIPEILNFIAQKELGFTSRSIKSGYKAKKSFIWGFEEPENSYEYRNAQILAEKFRDNYANNAQIFITTHSFNFLALEGEHISKYRVWKDYEIQSSRISKIKRDSSGKIKFETIGDFKSDWKKLEEELGFFYLNNELQDLYERQENDLKLLEAKIASIHKPIVYSEGYNMKYLEKAISIFAPSMELDFGDLGGKTDLKNFLLKLSRSNYCRFKMFFIFDCDAKGEYEACKKEATPYLIPYLIPINSDNSISEVQSGIENLFSDELFDDEHKLFDVTEVNRNGIVQSRTRKLRKKEFENYIIQERNNESDFVKFEQIVKFIENELNGTQQVVSNMAHEFTEE